MALSKPKRLSILIQGMQLLREEEKNAKRIHRLRFDLANDLLLAIYHKYYSRLAVMRYSLTSARDYAKAGNYKDAMVHYLVALMQKREMVAYYGQEFSNCLEGYAKSEPRHCLRNIVNSVQTLFKNTTHVLHQLGTHLIDADMKAEAYKVFEKAIEDNQDEKNNTYALRVIMSNLSTSVFDSWHIIMLNNKQRNTIYSEAIRQIKPGKLVLEIGSGTGILSVLAHWNNLDIVAVEESEELVAITQKALEINGTDNGKMKQVVHCNSTDFDILSTIGRRADVVIAEIFDCAAFGEGIISTFLDAHERLTNTDAVFIPRGFTVFVTLIQCESLQKIHAWQDIRTEYVCTEGAYPSEPYWCDDLRTYPDLVKLSEPYPIFDLDLTDKHMLKSFTQRKSIFKNLKTIRDGKIHAIVVHWHADMGPGLLLDSSMEGSCWDHAIFPVRRPHKVTKGRETQICVSLNYEGKRLDISLSDELENKNQDCVRVIQGQYLTMCYDLCFTREVENDVQPTECKIFASNPFNWKDSENLKKFLPYPFDCPLSIDNAFHPTLLLKVGAELTGLLEPPFDRLIFWPFFPDGGLNDGAITSYLPALLDQWKEECEQKDMEYVPPKVTPAEIDCQCQLIFSDTIASKCRLQPDSHLGINLKSPNHPMGLFECRDIYIQKLEHKVMSETFETFRFNFQTMVEDPADLSHRMRDTFVVEVECTDDGEVDGIFYWWKGKTFESKNQPSACFVFDQRIPVRKGQKLKIRCDMYQCQLLMTLESE